MPTAHNMANAMKAFASLAMLIMMGAMLIILSAVLGVSSADQWLRSNWWAVLGGVAVLIAGAFTCRLWLGRHGYLH
jgi:hypothetical protein